MNGRKHSTYRLVALSILTALYACANAEVDERRYEVKGQVIGVDAENGTVTLDHEAIGDFMAAMTMPFPLKDTWAFEYLEPGDGVNAILVVRGNEHWLEEVVITEAPTPLDADSVPTPRLGEPVPDVELVNQDGTNIHISDYRGKALLVTFIYTRCPLAEFCPRMTAQFGTLEGLLREEPDLYQNTHLLSISFDPAYDTPETLKAYGLSQAHVAEDAFGHWEFATGTPENIRELASFLQLDYSGEDEQIMHNLRTAIVAPDGTLFELHTGNRWESEDLLATLKTMTLEE